MKPILPLSAVLASLLTASPLFAANRMETWKQENMTSPSYLKKTGAMALNGAARLGAAPFELVNHPYDQMKNEEKGAAGFFEGLGIGVYHLGEDVVVGVLNIVGAPVPGYDGIHDLSRPK